MENETRKQRIVKEVQHIKTLDLLWVLFHREQAREDLYEEQAAEDLTPIPEETIKSGVARLMADTSKATPNGYDVVCSRCGVRTVVPFKPNPKRPVYCLKCYKEMNPQ